MRIFRHYFCGYGHQWVVPDSIISKFNSTVLFRILFDSIGQNAKSSDWIERVRLFTQ